jgi:transcriptional regulator with XRE-family HTH domain
VCRLAVRMSQQDLAAAAGLSRVFVSALERGRHGPNVLALRHLAGALGVALCDLVADAGPAGAGPSDEAPPDGQARQGQASTGS